MNFQRLQQRSGQALETALALLQQRALKDQANPLATKAFAEGLKAGWALAMKEIYSELIDSAEMTFHAVLDKLQEASRNLAPEGRAPAGQGDPPVSGAAASDENQ